MAVTVERKGAAMKDREAFFYENAGYSWDPSSESREEGRRKCARYLAEAEACGERVGLEVQWDYDYDAPYFLSDEAHEGPYYFAWVEGPTGSTVAALGGIDEDPCPQGQGILTPYARVIEAELLSEAR